MKLKITKVFYTDFNDKDNYNKEITFEEVVESHRLDAETMLESMFEIELPGINRVVEFSINKLETGIERIDD